MQAVQLSLLDLALQENDKSFVFDNFDPAKAECLRQMADKMQKAIDAKKNSTIGT